MSKQVRLPEEFIQELRQEYDGKNDMERLKNWKNKESSDKLVDLINKVDKLDVNGSSTSMNTDVVEKIVEDKITELKQRGII